MPTPIRSTVARRGMLLWLAGSLGLVTGGCSNSGTGASVSVGRAAADSVSTTTVVIGSPSANSLEPPSPTTSPPTTEPPTTVAPTEPPTTTSPPTTTTTIPHAPSGPADQATMEAAVRFFNAGRSRCAADPGPCNPDPWTASEGSFRSAVRERDSNPATPGLVEGPHLRTPLATLHDLVADPAGSSATIDACTYQDESFFGADPSDPTKFALAAIIDTSRFLRYTLYLENGRWFVGDLGETASSDGGENKCVASDGSSLWPGSANVAVQGDGDLTREPTKATLQAAMDSFKRQLLACHASPSSCDVAPFTASRGGFRDYQREWTDRNIAEGLIVGPGDEPSTVTVTSYTVDVSGLAATAEVCEWDAAITYGPDSVPPATVINAGKLTYHRAYRLFLEDGKWLVSNWTQSSPDVAGVNECLG